jgi:thiol peroxidase
MNKVTFKGTPIRLAGKPPRIGSKAKDFRLAAADLSDKGLSDFPGKLRILNCVPSLDTSVCALSAKRFEKEAAALPGLAVLTISMDLPFAQDRFCKGEGLSNVVFLSAFRDPLFAKAYGLRILDGPLAGLLARAVFIVDAEGIVRYAQYVPEIGQEPDYDSVMRAARELLGK